MVVFVCIGESCTESKKTPVYPELVETTQKIQERLPVTITDGYVFTKAEYKDTLLIMQMEVDEKNYAFESLVKAKRYQKQLFLTLISASQGDGRKEFEQCVSHDVSLRLHIIGKHTHKEMDILVTPEDIKRALKIKSSPLDVLKAQIEYERSSLPERIADGLTMTTIELRDSMVYFIVSLDEENYQFDGFEKLTKEIKEGLRESFFSDPSSICFINNVSNAHCGLVYSYVGSLSGKAYNIVFSSDEVSMVKTIYKENINTASGIVKNDE